MNLRGIPNYDIILASMLCLCCFLIIWGISMGTYASLTIIGYAFNLLLAIANTFLSFSISRAMVILRTVKSHVWKGRLKIYQKLWLVGRRYGNYAALSRSNVIQKYEDLLEKRGGIFFCSTDIRRLWFQLKDAYACGNCEQFDKLLEEILNIIEEEVG